MWSLGSWTNKLEIRNHYPNMAFLETLWSHEQFPATNCWESLSVLIEVFSHHGKIMLTYVVDTIIRMIVDFYDWKQVIPCPSG